jgi:indole-3-glycerol phosphate synthase
VTPSFDFLDRMVATRRADLAREFGDLPAADRERLACCARAPRDFIGAVASGASVGVIAEVKKASPSRGPIAPDLEASRQARVYEYGGAAAISVLTEPSAFGGSFHDLSDVADAVAVPVLCKDFVVDPLQLFVARGHGADAILLMVSILGGELGAYLDLAHTLGLAALVEVHDAAELDVATAAKARLVGVNSRDLRTLQVDVPGARALLSEAKARGHAVVAESGLRTRADVEAAAEAGADAVLVGEAVMDATFPEDVLAELTGVARREPVDA